MRNGCKNFRSLNWDNPDVDYEELDSCPSELLDSPPCWEANGNTYPETAPDTCARRELSDAPAETMKVVASGTASTTRYWDCSGGACGCGYGNADTPTHCPTNALFTAPGGNIYGAKFYGSAAMSNTLGGGNWLGEGCGKCWKLTGTGNIDGNSA